MKVGLTVGVIFISACSGGSGATTAASEQALTAANGDGVNGDGVNGDGVNGDGVNGDGVNGDGVNGDGVNSSGLGLHLVSVDLASGTLGSQALSSVAITGSELVAMLSSATLSGTDLQGVTFTGTSDTGTSVTVRVDAVAQESAPNADTWDYTVSYWDPAVQAWGSLCRDATGAAVPAYALSGYWSYAFGQAGGGGKVNDSSKFIFACKGLAALGKCVGWGYAPWRSINGVSLSPQHQACVRMVRADFCGNGISYTKNGNQIDLYDGVGVQADTEAWVKEAEWDANGARCFYAYNRSHTLDPQPTIPCYDVAKEDGCGDTAHFQTGALLIDEIPAL